MTDYQEEALYWRRKFEQLSYHVQALFEHTTRLGSYSAARAKSAALSAEERDAIKEKISLRDQSFRLEGALANTQERLNASEAKVRELESQVSELKLRLVAGFQAAVNPSSTENTVSSLLSRVLVSDGIEKHSEGCKSNASPESSAKEKEKGDVAPGKQQKRASESHQAPDSKNDDDAEFRRPGDVSGGSSQESAIAAALVSRAAAAAAASAAAATSSSSKEAPLRPTKRKMPPIPSSPAPRLLGAQNYLPVKNSVVRVQAAVRGWLLRSSLARGHRLKRGALVLELVNTERRYVNDLRTILSQYAAPLAAGLSQSSTSSALKAAAEAASGSSSTVSDSSNTALAALINDLRRLFSPLEVILLYNENFLEALELRLRQCSLFPAVCRIGDIVTQFADFLRCYVNYVTNFGTALAVLARCRENSLFRKLEKDCDERVIARAVAAAAALSSEEDDAGEASKTPVSIGAAAAAVSGAAAGAATAAATDNNTDSASTALLKSSSIRRSAQQSASTSIPSGPQLNSLLIKPIQRIPRYVLLLDQLLKLTPAGMRDHAPLTSALELMHAVGDKLNESKREAESFAAVVCVYRALQPKEAEIADLVQAHRRFVCEGAMRWWRDKPRAVDSKSVSSASPRTSTSSKRGDVAPSSRLVSSASNTSSSTSSSSPSAEVSMEMVVTPRLDSDDAECRLFLFNDCMIIARSKKGRGSGSGDLIGSALTGADQQLAAALGSYTGGIGSSSSSAPVFQVLAYIDLRHVTSVVSLPDDKETGFEHGLLLDTPNRSLSLFAPSAEERGRWIESISSSLEMLKNSLETLRVENE